MRGSLLECTIINYHSEFLLIWKHLEAANTHENLIVGLGSAFRGLLAGTGGALTSQALESRGSSWLSAPFFLLITSYLPPLRATNAPFSDLEAFYLTLPY